MSTVAHACEETPLQIKTSGQRRERESVLGAAGQEPVAGSEGLLLGALAASQHGRRLEARLCAVAPAARPEPTPPYLSGRARCTSVR